MHTFYPKKIIQTKPPTIDAEKKNAALRVLRKKNKPSSKNKKYIQN